MVGGPGPVGPDSGQTSLTRLPIDTSADTKLLSAVRVNFFDGHGPEAFRTRQIGPVKRLSPRRETHLDRIRSVLDPMVKHLETETTRESLLCCLGRVLTHVATLGAIANEPEVRPYLTGLHDGIDSLLRNKLSEEMTRLRKELGAEQLDIHALRNEFDAYTREVFAECDRNMVPRDYPTIKKELANTDAAFMEASGRILATAINEIKFQVSTPPKRCEILTGIALSRRENETNQHVLDKKSSYFINLMESLGKTLATAMDEWAAPWEKTFAVQDQDICAVAVDYWKAKADLKRECDAVSNDSFREPQIKDKVERLDKLLGMELLKLERGMKSAEMLALFRKFLGAEAVKLDFCEAVNMYRREGSRTAAAAMRIYMNFLQKPSPKLGVEQATVARLCDGLRQFQLPAATLGRRLSTMGAKEVDDHLKGSLTGAIKVPPANFFDDGYNEVIIHLRDSYSRLFADKIFSSFKGKHDVNF